MTLLKVSKEQKTLSESQLFPEDSNTKYDILFLTFYRNHAMKPHLESNKNG